MNTAAPVVIGNERAYNDLQTVHVLMKVLAGTCDGARTLDGRGFNRLHARFGHQIAETPFERLSDRQLWASRKVLETYKNTQLAPFWHLVPDIPEPPLDPTDAEQQERYAEWKRQREPGWQPPKAFRRMALTHVGNTPFVAILTNYDAKLNVEIKTIPGRRWDKANSQWVVPINHDTVERIADFASEHAFEIDPQVEQTVMDVLDQYATRIELSHAASMDGIEITLPDGLDLYPFQRVGVEYMRRTPNVLCADQMGLGKTPQSLVAVGTLDAFPCVVVCPASLKANWKREVEKWLPGKRVVVLDGKLVAPLRWMDGSLAFDIVIINYDILAKWSNHLVDFLGGKVVYADEKQSRQLPYDNRAGRTEREFYGTLILDEAHAVKNNKAQRTKNVECLIRACHYARRIFLSGTPVVNRPMEFWSLISLLGHGQEMGGLAQYRARYDNNYVPRLEELNTKARSTFMIRRLKRDVLKELPEKQYSIVPLEITNRREYEKAEGDVAHFFAQKKAEQVDLEEARTTYLMDALQRGMQGPEALAWVNEQLKADQRIVYATAYSLAERSEQLLRWEALKQLAVKGKMDAVHEWIDDFLESGEKLVVFATHTDVIESLARRYRAPYIHGGINPARRMPLVDRFQEDDDCKLIIGNMKAMGEGLTLTAASDVAFVEFGWNPKDHDQAEDRCHRIGQRDSVQVWSLAAEGTIDFEIAELIERKRAVTNAIQDGGGRDTQLEMMQELQSRLGARMKRR